MHIKWALALGLTLGLAATPALAGHKHRRGCGHVYSRPHNGWVSINVATRGFGFAFQSSRRYDPYGDRYYREPYYDPYYGRGYDRGYRWDPYYYDRSYDRPQGLLEEAPRSPAPLQRSLRLLTRAALASWPARAKRRPAGRCCSGLSGRFDPP